jgi:predicted O-methyltransferase YrrM
MAQNTRGAVFCIDRWGGNALTGGEYGAAGAIFAEFQTNTQGIPNIVPVTLDTVSAARLLGSVGLRFDMVFIDACHEYEAVKRDIETWRELLTPQGILCGHDFFGNYPGVSQAVRELLTPFRLINNIWTTEGAL